MIILKLPLHRGPNVLNLYEGVPELHTHVESSLHRLNFSQNSRNHVARLRSRQDA